MLVLWGWGLRPPQYEAACKAVTSHAAVARSSPAEDLYYARVGQGVLPMRMGGATSQLDLPSLMPLSVASCGRLQQGVPNWAASVHYYK